MPSPEVRVASTVDVDEFKSFGFDLSDLMSGKIRFVAKPLDDGGLQIAADLTQASLDLKDIGSVQGRRRRRRDQCPRSARTARLTKVTQIDLSFGQVRVKGGIEFDGDKGLVAADFSDFALSQGDTARLSVAPVDSGGFRVRISGEQFDLKPMLKRYFALDQPSTGAPQATAVAQELIISAKLQRALGFYGGHRLQCRRGARPQGRRRARRLAAGAVRRGQCGVADFQSDHGRAVDVGRVQRPRNLAALRSMSIRACWAAPAA